MNYTDNQYANYGVCEKCGAGIKYKYYYNNKTYGSTCIERMLGIKVERYNTSDVNAIIRQIEEDTRSMEQRLQDEKDLFLPMCKRVLGSQNVGAIGYKVDVDVLITDCFWFDGMYGSSCCVKMVDKDFNQFVAFTSAKWINDIKAGDKVKITGTVKKHKEVPMSKVKTINDEPYEINAWSIDRLKALQEGHSLGLYPDDHILVDFDKTTVSQTQLSRIKPFKEVA
tara:strand:- start:1 stop:675 length:675 start_codon:yes stop_codon:yes gene_type:complete